MTVAEIGAALSGRSPSLRGAGERFAVLVPLVDAPGGPELLFEVRAAGLRRQPGEVCFPGGRLEPGETAAACALRETWEELGIPRAAVEPIAPLDVFLQPSGALIHPVLGRVAATAAEGLRPNPAEVGETFRVPLDFFLARAPEVYPCDLEPRVGEDFPYAAIGFPQGYPWRGGRMEVPVYRWKGRAVWGLTGRIARHLAELLHTGEG